jgi:uncharacterized protein YkwD
VTRGLSRGRVLRRAALAIAIAALAAAACAAPAGANGLDALVAPRSACPNQTDAKESVRIQEQAMRCMTNFARERRRIALLADVAALDRAARHKSADILQCDDFSHEACGREFTFWMERFGYLGGGCSSAGENIAWGSGSRASVRSIFTAWIHSPGHRANILAPAFRDFGVGLRIGDLEGIAGAHVWTQDFGSHC